MLILFKRLLLCTGLLLFCIAQANEPARAEIDDLVAAKELWENIDINILDIQNLLENQRLNRIHFYTTTLRITVMSLPNFSSMLTKNQLTQVKVNVKLAQEMVEAIDSASHSNDMALAKQSLAKLKPILSEMRSSYFDVHDNASN